jgi:hypothetical protein
MVKPPLRTKSIGFKVSEEEYAQLETAAQAEGRTLGEWCREAILRGGSASDAERHDPALAVGGVVKDIKAGYGVVKNWLSPPVPPPPTPPPPPPTLKPLYD